LISIPFQSFNRIRWEWNVQSLIICGAVVFCDTIRLDWRTSFDRSYFLSLAYLALIIIYNFLEETKTNKMKLTTRLRPSLISTFLNHEFRLLTKLFSLIVLCITFSQCAPIVSRERRNVKSDVGAMVCIDFYFIKI